MPGLAAKIAAVLETRTRPLRQAQDKPALQPPQRLRAGLMLWRAYGAPSELL